MLFSDDDFVAIAAARLSRSTKSVGFCHGMDTFEAKPRYFMEYSCFDLYFSSVAEETEHIKKLSELFGYSHPLSYEYSYLRDKFHTALKQNTEEKVKLKSKPTILFLPVMRKTRPNMPIEKALPLPMEYLRYHYALVDYFHSREDYYFIWKALAQPFGRGDVIQRILKDKNISNIKFSTNSLKKWLPVVDRVICDVSSTAFFECIFTGLPVLAFYRPGSQKLWKEAHSLFGNSLQSSSTIGQSLNAIEEFLNDDPQKYVVSLSQKDNSLVDILSNYMSKSNLNKGSASWI